ncbi:hypothetical protein [Salininema proteolyticum]|uniref:Uncharacterized protein n=1 Tax=Salininema proteolyticum TaxID=1607685 RepID=A0ABV8U2F8_9ACTN
MFFTTVFSAAVILAGCGTATATDDETPEEDRPPSARLELTSAAAEAMDARYSAEYEWSGGGNVTVDLAEDGTWMVGVEDWALGGEADVWIAWTTGGFYQCVDEPEEQCVKIAAITGEIPEDLDPKVQLPFVRWLPRLADQHAPFQVAWDDGCFVLNRTTVVVDTPVPEGSWCFDGEGAIESVDVKDAGTLTLVGEKSEAPETVELPGQIVDGDPAGKEKPEEDEEEKKDDESGEAEDGEEAGDAASESEG